MTTHFVASPPFTARNNSGLARPAQSMRVMGVHPDMVPPMVLLSLSKDHHEREQVAAHPEPVEGRATVGTEVGYTRVMVTRTRVHAR
jgi:hypothetical protein